MMTRRLVVLAGLLVGLLAVWLFVGCGGGGSPPFAPPTTDIHAGSRAISTVELSFNLSVGDPDDPGDPDDGDPAALTAAMTVDSDHTYFLTSNWGKVVSMDDEKSIVQVKGTYASKGNPHPDLGTEGTFNLTFTINTETNDVQVRGSLGNGEKRFRFNGKGHGRRNRGYAFVGRSKGFIYDE